MIIGFSFASTSDCLVAPATGGCGGAAERNGECIVSLPSPFTGTPPVGIVPEAIVPFIPTLFNPLNVPPGCQPHPYPGKNDHVPEGYGSHPHGYGDTNE